MSDSIFVAMFVLNIIARLILSITDFILSPSAQSLLEEEARVLDAAKKATPEALLVKAILLLGTGGTMIAMKYDIRIILKLLNTNGSNAEISRKDEIIRDIQKNIELLDFIQNNGWGNTADDMNEGGPTIDNVIVMLKETNDLRIVLIAQLDQFRESPKMLLEASKSLLEAAKNGQKTY